MKPSIGPSSAIGWAAAAASLIAGIVISIQENQDIFSGSAGLATKISAGILVFTHIGRQYQAAHLPAGEVVGEVLDELPKTLEGVPVLDTPPQPDVGDGPDVELSGAKS